MRGNDNQPQVEMYSYIPLETRIPANHPLRKIREIMDSVLEEMDKEFDALYSHTGRPSVPPEMLLKALFLQILYGIRSERLLLEQIDFNFLYRWFIGLKSDDKIWDETVFSKNRERLLNGEIADRLFEKVIALANRKNLVSNDHFTVDGTLIEAWASLKSFQKKDAKKKNRKDDGDPGNPTVDFHGEKRRNDTHESTTDPESKLYRKSKGQTAKLSYMGHVLMENRNGLAVGVNATIAGYYAEHDAALAMLDELGATGKKTLGADKHYDNDAFCESLRKRNVTPHVAANIHARKFRSAIDGRTTRHPGYEISQRKRKRVEEIFGWLKAFSIMRRPHFRGLDRIEYLFKFAVSVYNILRIRNIMMASN
ncbi:MAG TPA: IS5 family transposase [Rectinema sp.]|nr:IS5 family transposase [Rectinema sp.]